MPLQTGTLASPPIDSGAPDDGPLPYVDAGGGPNVLVLLHGNFGSPLWWRPVLDRLPPGFRAIAPVLRGCAGRALGRARRGSVEITDLADDIFDLVQRLGLPRFHLVGHSLGGAVAMQLALDHPEAVRTVTLVASAPAAGLSAMREGKSPAARLLRMFDPDSGSSMGLLEMSFRMHSAFGTKRMMLKSALADLMPTAPDEGPMFEALVDDAVRMMPEAAVAYYKALHRWNVERELRRISMPTLVLACGKDAIVPRAALEKTAGLLPRGELVEWPHVGHSPMIESPDAFIELVIGFCVRESWWARVWTFLWLFWSRVVSARRRGIRARLDRKTLPQSSVS